jgi:hypothetical protein
MAAYHFAGRDFHFSAPISELRPFEVKNAAVEEVDPFVSQLFRKNKLISRTEGWVAGAQRIVEIYDTLQGMLLKVEGGGEFFITPHGEIVSRSDCQSDLQELNREIILGPVLVLALALRDVWSLHASAVMYKESVIVFLGESGQGKSTLAGYLSQSPGWRRVADDILPVQVDGNKINVLPHFPQLKLPLNAQPGVGLPEHIPLKTICVLRNAEPDQIPELQKLSMAQGVQSLLGHITGTRMFNATLLAKHLEFATQAAKQIPAYQLVNPHRRDTLPLVQELLETIC